MTILRYLNVSGLAVLVRGIIGYVNLLPVIPARIPFVLEPDTVIPADLTQSKPETVSQASKRLLQF